MVVRWIAAVVAFVATLVIGIVAAGGSFTDYEAALAAFPWITAAAVIVSFAVYSAIEFAQTGAVTSVARQFGTRTIVLMPIAIAVNVVLGQTVAAALKIPIYLDSIGTIIVGALAGPIAGALTGLLSNLLWTYVLPPPFHSDFAAPFAITAVVIGLFAGVFGRAGLLRPRPGSRIPQLALAAVIALVVVGGLAAWTYGEFYSESFSLDAFTFFNPTPDVPPDPVLVVIGWLIAGLLAAAVIGFLLLLIVRRDAGVAYVVVAGAITGVVAAMLSAPIAANLFGGVTGAGTDFLVAFFRQQGSDVLTASFQQGLISDPIDKITTFLLVFIIVAALPARMKARFPQGERLVEVGEEVAPDDDGWRGATA